MKRKPWHENQPELLSEIDDFLRARYPTLHVALEGQLVRIRGSLPVEFEGRELGRFQIMICFPSDYPESMPRVYETGGAIPWNADRHVYVSGMACLFVDEERWLAWPQGATFARFLEGPVRNYYLSQAHFMATGGWPVGWEPRSHNEKGLIESYGEMVEATDEPTVLRYMWVLSKDVVKGHWLCPCGSSKNLRSCHARQLRELHERIPYLKVRSRFRQFNGLEKRCQEAYESLTRRG